MAEKKISVTLRGTGPNGYWTVVDENAVPVSIPGFESLDGKFAVTHGIRFKGAWRYNSGFVVTHIETGFKMMGPGCVSRSRKGAVEKCLQWLKRVCEHAGYEFSTLKGHRYVERQIRQKIREAKKIVKSMEWKKGESHVKSNH